MKKVGQFTEYIMRNIFLEKRCTKCDEKPSAGPLKKAKLSTCLNQQS